MRPLRDESGQLAGPRAGFARHSSKIVCSAIATGYMVHTYAVAIALQICWTPRFKPSF